MTLDEIIDYIRKSSENTAEPLKGEFWRDSDGDWTFAISIDDGSDDDGSENLLDDDIAPL